MLTSLLAAVRHDLSQISCVPLLGQIAGDGHCISIDLRSLLALMIV